MKNDGSDRVDETVIEYSSPDLFMKLSWEESSPCAD